MKIVCFIIKITFLTGLAFPDIERGNILFIKTNNRFLAGLNWMLDFKKIAVGF